MQKSKRVGPPRSQAQRVAEIRTAISENFADPHVSIELIATKCGISRHYLATVMNRSGSTFSRELMAQRLNAARVMLESGPGWLVKQVAYDTGFKSAAHFSRAYKRRFGHSPRLAQAGLARLSPLDTGIVEDIELLLLTIRFENQYYSNEVRQQSPSP